MLSIGTCQLQFAVLYEHRASASLDRMGIINAFVDQVPKVTDLNTVKPLARCHSRHVNLRCLHTDDD